MNRCKRLLKGKSFILKVPFDANFITKNQFFKKKARNL